MSPVLLFILGVVFVAIGIAVSIALHEVGHLLPAKLFKVRVTKYMIGFGPTLWSRKKGETEYGFKAIPLGGFVSMIGMYPPNKDDGTVRPSSTGMFQSLASDARSLAHEEVGPADENRVFYRLPVWKKIVVMLGGPAMNMLIGLALTAVLLMGFGIATQTTTIADVSKCQVKPPAKPWTRTPPTASSRPPPPRACCPTTSSPPSTARPSPAGMNSPAGSARPRTSRSASPWSATASRSPPPSRRSSPRVPWWATTAGRPRTTTAPSSTRTSASWASARRPPWCRSRRRPSCRWRGRTSSRLPASS